MSTGQMVGQDTSADVTGRTVTATGSSTARTLAARFGEVFNVKDFGAVGNGIADDTAAIQAAITAAAGGGVIIFPPGTYSVAGGTSSATIFSVSTSNLTLRGAGMKSTIIKATSFMANGHIIFKFTGTKQAIEDMGFDAAATSVSSRPVEFYGATDGSVRRCWVQAQWGWTVFIQNGSQRVVVSDCISEGTTQSHNFEINGSSYCVIERNRINSNANTGNGVEVYDNEPLSVLRNVVKNNWISGPRGAAGGSSGIQTFGAKHTLIEGNIIEDAPGYGIYMDASGIDSAILSQDNVVKGNMVRGTLGVAGILVGGAIAIARRTTVTGNIVTDGGTGGSGSMGISVNQASDTTVCGNVVSGNGGTGIYNNTSGLNTTISANVVTDNSGIGVGSRSGITSYGDFALIMGNMVNDSRGGSARQTGIVIGAGSDNVKLIGNSVPFAQGGPWITDSGTGTVKIGNYGLAVDKPSITGSRAGNAALASLLTALAGQGHIVDSTTA